jgi:hypothetical protein
MFPLPLLYWDQDVGAQPGLTPPTFDNAPGRQLRTWVTVGPYTAFPDALIVRVMMDHQFFVDKGVVLKFGDYLGILYGGRCYTFTVAGVVPSMNQLNELLGLYVTGIPFLDMLAP